MTNDGTRAAACAIVVFVGACGDRPRGNPSARSAAVLAPSSLRANSAPPLDAGAARVEALRARLGPEFKVGLEPPFVVAGDSPQADLNEQVATLRWAIKKLKQDFFTMDPTRPIDVYLFRDAESYERNVQALFHVEPVSRYGWYSDDLSALIMNIGTGGGTLVHELVHAFMVANFPSCPPWFNEGLGALFERPSELDGRIQGFPNWRQPILQTAIRERRTIPFHALFQLDGSGFYGAGLDVHYAEARYLLYWVQLKDALPTFYREFLAHRADDPTGEATLGRVLGEPDLEALQRRWEKWALALGPPD
jgi:hypothetical protein